MDLEEIQAVWSKMSDQLEQQKKLTDKIILEMKQERFANKFRTITTIETIGALICFIAAIFMLINFNDLNTWYLQVCGIFSIFFLIGLPILTLQSLRGIQKIDLIHNTITETW